MRGVVRLVFLFLAAPWLLLAGGSMAAFAAAGPLGVAPTPYSFNSVTAGQTARQTFTVSYTPPTPVSGGAHPATSLAFVADHTAYAIDNDHCTGAAKPSCSFDVTFTPPREGTFTATVMVNVTDDTGTEPALHASVTLTGSAPGGPVATPTPVPTPQGSLVLDPAAAPAGGSVKLTGTGFPTSQSFPVNLDGTVVSQAPTDSTGAIAIVLTIPALTPPGGHVVCVSEPAGNLCANLTVQPAPSPSPSPSPSALPSPSPSPSPSDAALPASSGGTGSLTLLGTLTRPPFVFFPILLLLALVGAVAYLVWSRRPGLEIGEVTVQHSAPMPRDYETPPASPTASAPKPAPPAPIHYESAEPHPPRPAAREQPPVPPSGADVPPELPEASD